MRLRKPTLAEITKECFGSYADYLLDRGAVHPILGQDRKQPGYAGYQEPYRDIHTTNFLALGFTPGALSGITVWDVDRQDMRLPVTLPNVITTKGVHVYTPYAGEKHLQVGIDRLDVLTKTNAVFWDDGYGKRFVHGEFVASEVMHGFWQEEAGTKIIIAKGDISQKRTGTRITSMYVEGEEGTGTCALSAREAGYRRRVEAAGFRLDLERIEVGALLQLGGAGAGSRNRVLHRKVAELVQCEIDPWVLEPTALAAGLKPQEVTRTIERAVSSFRADRVPEVMDYALRWAAAVKQRVKLGWHDLLDEVVRMAIEQNTVSPMITQSSVRSVVNRSTTSRRLDALVKRGFLVKRYMGVRPNGLRRSNCYRLTVPGNGATDG